MTRWILQFEAIDPRNPERRWETGIPEKLYRNIQHHGHEKAIARLFLVGEVLQGGTERIYGGWSRPDKVDCYVYAGLPQRDFKSLQIETPAPKGMVFLVFVLPDGTIDEWTWREIAEDGGNQPAGIQGELLWSLKPN